MGTNAGQAGGTTSDPATPFWTLLVWKLKTAGILFLNIIMLQGCYQAWQACEKMIRKYICFRDVPVGQDLMEVGLSRLPYLPQTVSKEQSSRKGEKDGVWGRATGQKATRLLLVSDTLPGSHKAHSQSLHLDRENTVNSYSPLLHLLHSFLCCFLNKMFRLYW